MAKPKELVADGRRWEKVQGARVWRPLGQGETVIGEFLGRSLRTGTTGAYETFLIKTDEGTLSLSGTVLKNLFDDGAIQPGVQVRVVFLGLKQGTTNTYKDFDVYVQR